MKLRDITECNMSWRVPSQGLTLKITARRWLILLKIPRILLKIPGNASTVSDGLDEIVTCSIWLWHCC